MWALRDPSSYCQAQLWNGENRTAQPFYSGLECGILHAAVCTQPRIRDGPYMHEAVTTVASILWAACKTDDGLTLCFNQHSMIF